MEHRRGSDAASMKIVMMILFVRVEAFVHPNMMAEFLSKGPSIIDYEIE